jgi:Ni/Co efflux regulator RcnB
VFVKRSHIAAALLFSSLGLASVAFAQGAPGGPGGPDNHGGPNNHGGPDNHGNPQQRPGGPGMQGHGGGGNQNQSQNQYHGSQGGPGAQQHGNDRPPMHADNGPGHGGPGGPGGPHGDSPRDWHRGDRLPNDYRDRQYVVDDYRGYGLHQPPRGYHWVGVGGDYVLAAVASGVIAQIVISNSR